MSDQVGNPEDRFSRVAAQFKMVLHRAGSTHLPFNIDYVMSLQVV